MTTFIERLRGAWTQNDSLVCVGLDPEIERLPAEHRAALAGALDAIDYLTSGVDKPDD